MAFLCFLSLLLLAACHSDDNEPVPAGEDPQTVTVTLSLEDFRTRAISETDDDEISRLLMQVIDNGNKGTAGSLPLSDGTATTTRKLYPSHKYTFLFWADGGSYAATDLTAVTLNDDLTGTQAGIAYAACVDWDGSSTAIDATLTHAVSKVTLKTTSKVWADNELTLTVPQTCNGYNVQAGTPAGNPAEYAHSHTPQSNVEGTEDEPKELFSFYVLAPNASQDLTVGSNGETVTVPTNLSGGKHFVLKGNLGRMTEEKPAAANVTLSIAEWTQEEIPVGIDKLTDATTAGDPLQGEGTAENPYLIKSAADLRYYFINDGYRQQNVHARLDIDIEMDTSNWNPVTLLGGVFDGNGHTISGSIRCDLDQIKGANNICVGLFNGIDKPAVVRNLNVSADITVTGTSEEDMNSCYVAGIVAVAGEVTYETSVINCTYSGNITVSATVKKRDGSIFIGGIAGQNSGKISDCTFSGKIDASGASASSMRVGGIVGSDRLGSYINNVNSGTVITPPILLYSVTAVADRQTEWRETPQQPLSALA